MKAAVPPLLRAMSTDEYAPLPRRAGDERALAAATEVIERAAGRLRMSVPAYATDRRGTAASLRAIDEAHGGGFFAVPERAVLELDAADEAFRGDAPVIDVQTHLVDPTRWVGAGAAALAGFLRMADPDRWPGEVDPRVIDGAAWAALVFGASETAIALLTSTPGPAASNVLTNEQIAAARDVVDRYAGSGRVLTHTIVHPNLGAHELDAMEDWRHRLHPSGWKCYTLYGPPTNASPGGGWFLDDDEIGLPFLERVDALGPRVVAAHKGLGGPVPERSLDAASPRDIGPAAAAFPRVKFVVYHSGYERDPDGQEGPYDAANATQGVDRLIKSVETAGIGPDGNVYAELGSTWFLMLRRPFEAAHVLGKLLAALGPERIVWGTDSTWYGSPQPLIDAFRAFAIPTRMQEEFGYPPLTPSVAERILSKNAQALYGVSDDALDAADRERDRQWVSNASTELDACHRAGGAADRALEHAGVGGVLDGRRLTGRRQQERTRVLSPRVGRGCRAGHDRRPGRSAGAFVGDDTHEGTDHDEGQDRERHQGEDHTRSIGRSRPDVKSRRGRTREPLHAGVERRRVTLQRDAGPTVDPDRRRAGDGDALAPPVDVSVVDDRAVLRRLVVPHRDVSDSPVPADGVLGTRNVFLERADDRARQLVRIADDPMRESAEQQRALTRLGMHPHHGMFGPIDRRDELLAALDPVGIRPATVDPHVGRRVRVHDTQTVGKRAQLGREVRVHVHRVGPDGVAADFGDHDPS